MQNKDYLDEVFAFIIRYIEQHQYSPTVREIADGVGFSSTSSVQPYIKELLEQGRLETDISPRQPRAIRVPGYRFSREDNWIPCSRMLPGEKINPLTGDYYEYEVTFRDGNVTDIRHYKFGDGHWWNGPGNVDKYVTAWRPHLKPYQGK